MSGEYLGDFPSAGQVIPILFNTFDSNDPSASVTITGLALADIQIYKGVSVTQRSSTAGFVLLDTDGIDFDTTTGIHGISIDTADNTDAGFYTAGNDYTVVIASITVDAATVNFVAARFSIDNRGLLRPTTAQRTLDVTATGAAGIDWGNVENPTTALDLSGTDIQLVDTTTTNTDMRGTDSGATAASLATAQADLDIITDSDGVVLGAVGVGLVWDEVLIGSTHNINNSSGKRLRQIDASFVVHSGTAQAGAASAITLDTGANATDNIYNGDRVIIVGGTGAEEHGIITAYNGTTKVATMSEPWVVTPDATSDFELTPASVDIETWQHNVVTASAGGLPDVNVNEVGDTAQTAGDLAALITTVDTVVDGIQTDLSNGTDGLGAIKTDTAEIQGDWTNGGRLDLLLDRLITEFDTATGEPAQGAPGVSIKRGEKIDWLYKFLRNRSTSTATAINVYNDDSTTVDHKMTHSDDGATYNRGEVATGP